jgi:hypothetical protein
MKPARTVAAVLAFLALAGCGGGVVMASLPALDLPSTRGGPPGDYGWQGRVGDRPTGMHWVVGNHEASAMTFAVGPGCLAADQQQKAVTATVAGFNGVVVEDYQPPVTFGSADGDEMTTAYELGIGDRTLCAFVTRNPTTTPTEHAAALHVLDSIRAQLVGTDGLRITFKLEGVWDTG